MNIDITHQVSGKIHYDIAFDWEEDAGLLQVMIVLLHGFLLYEDGEKKGIPSTKQYADMFKKLLGSSMKNFSTVSGIKSGDDIKLIESKLDFFIDSKAREFFKELQK